MPNSSRRDFLRKIGFGLGAAGLYHLGSSCDPSGSEDNLDSGFFDKDKQSSNSSGSSGSGSSGGTSSKNYWENYSPKGIVHPPYSDLKFWTEKRKSDSASQAIMTSFGRDIQPVKIYKKHYGGMTLPVGEGADVFLSQDKVDRRRSLLSVFNYSDKFSELCFPMVLPPSKLKSAGNSPITMTLPAADDWDSSSGPIGGKLINFPNPGWNPEKLDYYNDSIYIGDWSFSDLKDLVGFSARTAAFFIDVFGGSGAATTAMSYITVAGELFDKTDDLISVWNKLNPNHKIDKDKRFSLFLPSSELNSKAYATLILGEPVGSSLRNQEESIQDFIVTEPYFWAEFKNSSGETGTVKSVPLAKLKGEEVIKMTNDSNFTEYFGYNSKGDLCHVAEHYPDLGLIGYEDILPLYPARIKVGDKVNASSNIFLENYPEIKGQIDVTVQYLDREIVNIPDLSTFGSAFRVASNYVIRFTIDGETVGGNFNDTIWLAKNVGKIKQDFNGEVSYLHDSSVFNRLEDGTKSARINENSSRGVSGLVKKIIDYNPALFEKYKK